MRSDPVSDSLQTVAKDAFPFTLACPSFVFRAGYTENVRRLGPHVDEIQLLFFESRPPGSLPASSMIDALAELGREKSLTFSVHLPSDIFLGHNDANERRRAAEVIMEVIDRCAPLCPSTFTLHLERDRAAHDHRRWQERTIAALRSVLDKGIDSRCISVENLDYDFILAVPVVEALDLSVCMDIGHLLARGEAIAPFFDRWRHRIPIMHLHGVAGNRDHLPLDRMSACHVSGVQGLLDGFAGVVTVEVYSEAALEASLAWLKDRLTP